MKIGNNSLLASCSCGRRFFSVGNPFGASCSHGCRVRAERAAEKAAVAEVAGVRATSVQLARRLVAANTWAVRLGVSPKAIRIPGLPDHSTAELLKKQIGTFEEFLRLREAGDIARQRKLRGR